MTEPRTPMSTGSTSRRQVDDFCEVVTVTDPVDGTVWQHYDIWMTGMPDSGRDFYVTHCEWVLTVPDSVYARRVLEWQYDRPLQRRMIDQEDVS